MPKRIGANHPKTHDTAGCSPSDPRANVSGINFSLIPPTPSILNLTFTICTRSHTYPFFPKMKTTASRLHPHRLAPCDLGERYPSIRGAGRVLEVLATHQTLFFYVATKHSDILFFPKHATHRRPILVRTHHMSLGLP